MEKKKESATKYPTTRRSFVKKGVMAATAITVGAGLLTRGLGPLALGNLTARDGADSSLFYMFNFTQTPLKPLVLPNNSLATYPLNSTG